LAKAINAALTDNIGRHFDAIAAHLAALMAAMGVGMGFGAAAVIKKPKSATVLKAR